MDDTLLGLIHSPTLLAVLIALSLVPETQLWERRRRWADGLSCLLYTSSFKEVELSLTEVLGRRVKVTTDGTKGKLEIE